MSHKEELLRHLDDGYATFKETFAGLSEPQMTQTWLDHWCLRDILAHIAGWHRVMSNALERMARGERPTPEGVDYSNADVWNERFVGERQSLSPTDGVNDLDQSFDAFRTAAAALPEERFEPGRTVDRMLHTTGMDHYREHGDQITRWRQGL